MGELEIGYQLGVAAVSMRCQFVDAAKLREGMMMMLGRCFLAASLIVAASPTIAQDAPFGLEWGMSEQELVESGVVVIDRTEEGELSTSVVDGVPVEPSNTAMIGLNFHVTLGLQRVSWASESISDDAFGFEGREQYSDLREIFLERFGEAVQVIEQTGLNLYRDADEFYQCLRYDGCGAYWSIWEAEGVTISLRIMGTGRGSGYLFLQYEGPGWGEALDRNEAANAERDRGAF